MSVFDDPTLFGRLWSDSYDRTSCPDPTAAVEFLAELAGDGSALELAIGTGRVALPLSARGVSVQGIDASQEMINVMRAKPGGDAIPVTIGDMADVAVEGQFSLVYLVYNTLFNLTGAGRQEDCFRNVARVLAPGGAFVVEAYVPTPPEPGVKSPVEVRSVTEDSVELRLHQYDQAAQTFIRQTVMITDGSTQLKPFSLHYQWPEQIDALAASAGLRLERRCADWTGAPFGPASSDHISVYRQSDIAGGGRS